MEAAQVLWTNLQRGNNITSLIHNLVYALIGEPISGADTNQWNCPLTCWLAILSVKSDRKFRSAVHYTPVLAQWQSHIRTIHIYQAELFKDKYMDGLLEYVFFSFPFSRYLIQTWMFLELWGCNMLSISMRRQYLLGILFMHTMSLLLYIVRQLPLCIT